MRYYESMYECLQYIEKRWEYAIVQLHTSARDSSKIRPSTLAQIHKNEIDSYGSLFAGISSVHIIPYGTSSKMTQRAIHL